MPDYTSIGHATITRPSRDSIAQDPIGFSGGDPNLYNYTADSPIALNDPLGLLVGTVGGSAGGQIWGPVGGNVSVGLAIDDSGHVAFYFEFGLGYVGFGASENAGISLGIYPSAACVKSIQGGFGTQSFGGGTGVGATVDTFQEKDPSTDKPIFGWGTTVGEGLGFNRDGGWSTRSNVHSRHHKRVSIHSFREHHRE